MVLSSCFSSSFSGIFNSDEPLGRIVGTLPPSPPRCMPSMFIAGRMQHHFARRTAYCLGVAGEFGWLGFLVCFPIYNQSQRTINNLLWQKKVAQIPLCLTLLFLSWVGLGLGIGRFHSHIYMFSNPTEFGKSLTP